MGYAEIVTTEYHGLGIHVVELVDDTWGVQIVHVRVGMNVSSYVIGVRLRIILSCVNGWDNISIEEMKDIVSY